MAVQFYPGSNPDEQTGGAAPTSSKPARGSETCEVGTGGRPNRSDETLVRASL